MRARALPVASRQLLKRSSALVAHPFYILELRRSIQMAFRGKTAVKLCPTPEGGDPSAAKRSEERFSDSAEERSNAYSGERHTSEDLRPNPTTVLRGSGYSVNAP
jgi:hypothetical protein